MSSSSLLFLLLLFLLLTSTTTSLPPNWVGTYKIDDSCATDECCCFAEQAKITYFGPYNQLIITTGLAGRPCASQINSTTYTFSINMPQDKSGYQTTFVNLGTLNRFRLSEDSRYISGVNLQYPKCSGNGLRIQ
ncbi:unnamed protein product [Didymodactylos carnosus]|uniref:Uncharacterized protein n=1 Tax=Didymodactylos carnosus TaxID=1234261 RepID=A0A815LII0_9BILA|nr:unnamed protein product [Didymodactylos carnosus]CAF1403717.1 unnamed protein product [Didymodactylos carnosus]CAF4095864.1 unnamed protein product [Didymodactylos carnosus]CAF4296183.1 unnamed protein product [Didymodactylos carnosus]